MKEILVFTTNVLGQHTNAAAKLAYKKYGARWGMAYGHYGNSFAIPVRDGNGNRIKEGAIYGFIEGFIAYASSNPPYTLHMLRMLWTCRPIINYWSYHHDYSSYCTYDRRNFTWYC